MQQHGFGRLAPVSVLTLGGGGLGMLSGETSFAECVATVHEAVEAGITLFDLAPRYGDGKAEEVVGAARVRGSPANAISARLHPSRSKGSCGARSKAASPGLRLSRLDLFFLHS